MKRFICLTLFSLSLIHAPTLEAKTHRSYAVKAEFKRLHPCPANGKRRGPCPNYQVDRKIPLKCKGRDAVDNMQWLTVEAHKAKTKREARWCRRAKKG